MSKFFTGVMSVVLALAVSFSMVEAKPGGGFGGGRSSFSSGSRSSSSSSSRAAPSRSWSSGSTSKPATTSKPAVSSTAKSVDSKVNASTKSSGFATKQAATNAFKAKYADSTKKGGQFTSHYDKEPTSRPAHIPTTTSVGGSNVNVVYNGGYGGYGYMHPTLGTWIMYDMLSDAAMISAMSHNHGYVAAQPGTAVVHTSGAPYIFFTLFVVVAGVLVLIVFVNKTGRYT